MKFLTMPVLYALLAIAAASLLFGGIQSYRLARLQTKSIVCQTDRANFARTQTGNLAKIDGLIHDFNVLAESRRVEANASAQALRKVDAEAAKSEAKADDLAARLQALYAQDRDAHAWGMMGVDAGVAAELPR